MFPAQQLKEGKLGHPAKYYNRGIMNGILWIERNRAPCRKLSERYGKWQAVYARFRLWTSLQVCACMQFLLIPHPVKCIKVPMVEKKQKTSWYSHIIFAYQASYTIDSMKNNLNPWTLDCHSYKKCHLIEFFFQKIK